MHKLRLATAILFVFSIVFVLWSPVDAETRTDQNKQQSITLTEAQKKELAALQKDILTKKKQIISKYVEFGVLTEEQGQKISKHFDEHYKKLEKDGFIPRWNKPDYQKRKQCDCDK